MSQNVAHAGYYGYFCSVLYRTVMSKNKHKQEKVSYIVAALASKYRVSERKVYDLIKRFKTDCNLLAV